MWMWTGKAWEALDAPPPPVTPAIEIADLDRHQLLSSGH
jgi:hypothetical protein